MFLSRRPFSQSPVSLPQFPVSQFLISRFSVSKRLSVDSAKTIAALALAFGLVMIPVMSANGGQTAHAEKYQSRLNHLLIRKSDAYLPTRLLIGQENKFVVKAPAGSMVRVLLSAEGEGYALPNGTSLRVGKEVQELGGIVPESGVLEVRVDMPDEPSLEGKVVYVDVVAGPSIEQLAPIDLVDATGRRTDQNTLVVARQTVSNGPMVMPGMPGLNPQLFNQITQLGQIYGNKDDHRKELLDNGSINQNRDLDQNPFAQRGIQKGIGN